MNMNKDDFIMKKFQEDNIIPDKVNKVFEDFKKSNMQSVNKKSVNSVYKFNEYYSENDAIKIIDIHTENNVTKSRDINKENMQPKVNINQNNYTNNTNQTGKIFSFFSYKNINKMLSVAAVFLCVVLVGMGTLVKNKSQNIENINIVTSRVSIKNKEINFSNDKVITSSENTWIKASIIGEKQVAIELKENFIEMYGLNFAREKKYEVANITKNVKDIFVGSMISFDRPCVLLIMEDGTAECIQILNDDMTIDTKNYEFDFYSQGKIRGLNNVVGFEQQSRYYSNSSERFYYINAIRGDGKRKEIDLGYYNDWDDTSTLVYDLYNAKYLNKEEDENEIIDDDIIVDEIEDNETQTDEVENNETQIDKVENDEGNNNQSELNSEEKIEYIQFSTDENISYYLEKSNLYKLNKTTNSTNCVATGVQSFNKNTDGTLIAWLDKEYTINEIDYNVVFNENDVSKSTNLIGVECTEAIRVELKDDGSLTLQFLKGGLEKLGFNGKTNLKENVRYNIYGDNEAVYNEKTDEYVADAKQFKLGVVGVNATLSLVYAKNNNVVVCLNLEKGITENNLHYRNNSIHGLKEIIGFKQEDLKYMVDPENSEETKSYKTIWYIQKLESGEQEELPITD